MKLFERDIDETQKQFHGKHHEIARTNIEYLAEFDSSNIRVQQLQCLQADRDENWQKLMWLTRRAIYFSPFDEELKYLRQKALRKLGNEARIDSEVEMHTLADQWEEYDSDYLSYADEEIIADVGVLYIAFDKTYIEEAVFSAKSMKKQHPTLKCALITKGISNDTDIFDKVIIANTDFLFKYYFRDPKRMPSVKVQYLRLSPFRKTLYLDSDTYIARSVDDIFEGLKHSDFMFFEVPLARHRKVTGREHTDFFLRSLVCPCVLDSGVIAFRKSARMDHFFDIWISTFIAKQSGPARTIGNWGGINDQRVLNDLIRDDVFTIAGIRAFCLPGWQFNSKEFSLDTLKDHAMIDDVHIFHMNNISAIIKRVGADNIGEAAPDLPRTIFNFPLIERPLAKAKS